MLTAVLRNLYPFALSVLRVAAGFLFWQHGAQRLFGWFGGQAAPFASLPWVGGLLDSVGGLLIVIGLFTRPVALLLAGEMAVSYWIMFLPRGVWPIRNGGEVSLQFLIIFLVLFTAGPGKIAVDQLFSHAPALSNTLDRFTPVTLTLLRVVTGVLFWQHGAAKWGLLGGRVVPFPQLRFFARILEFFGGPLVSLGLFMRPLAFLLSGEMATAFWIEHVPRGLGLWPIQNAGELAVLNCFIYLFLVTAGAGPWSLDGLLFRKPRT